MKNILMEAIADCLRKEAHVECDCVYTIANYEGPYYPIKTSAYGGNPKNLVSVYIDKTLVCLYVPRVKTLSEFQQKYKFPALSLVSDKSTATVGKGYHCVFINAVYFQPLLTGKDATNIRQFLISAVRESLAMRGLSKTGQEKLLNSATLVKSSQAPTSINRSFKNNAPSPGFTEALFDVYRKTLKQTGYNAHSFHTMLQEMPGIEVAIQLVSSSKGTEGFTKLSGLARLDLTVEAIMLQPEWAPLFSEDILIVAYNRLNEYGYEFPKDSWTPSNNKLILSPLTPQASDLDEGPAARTESTTYRILRDTELARRVKAMHNGCCQICGVTIKLPDGTNYAEAHHIQPLGQPHNGPDVIGNIICVCPNHHAELDYRAITLDLTKIRNVLGHSVGLKFVEYHNRVQAKIR